MISQNTFLILMLLNLTTGMMILMVNGSHQWCPTLTTRLVQVTQSLVCDHRFCFYQGEWKPRQIDNPAYKGEWVHPTIANPEYEEDDSLYMYEDFGSIGFDLWQVTGS